MDGFINTVDAIGEHGLAFALSALVIYILVRGVNIMFTYLTTHVKNAKHDKHLQIREEVDQKVTEKIKDYLMNHSGSRVQVIEFTNSVTSVAYLPFRYMTCTYEVFEYGQKREAQTVDKLSTSLFSPFLSKLSKDGLVVLDDETAEDFSGSVHDIFAQIGSRYELCAIMKTGREKSIGFVCFCKEKEISTRDKQDIKTLATELSALLGVLDK